MTVDEIKEMIRNVNYFERDIRIRVNELLDIKGSTGWFDHIIWNDSNEDVMVVYVDDKWNPGKETFPTDFLGDDFDLNLYKKQIEESKKRTAELFRQEVEKDERELYKRLKAKYEKEEI